MLWVIYSIIAVLIWSIVNIVDKHILEKRIKNSLIPVVIFGVIGLLIAIIIYLLQGFQPLSGLNIILALIAGIFLKLTNVFYFKATKIEEISRVIPLLSLSPLFVLILATIFLGEVFKPLQYLGIFLLVIGAILLSTKNFKEEIRLSKAFCI